MIVRAKAILSISLLAISVDAALQPTAQSQVIRNVKKAELPTLIARQNPATSSSRSSSTSILLPDSQPNPKDAQNTTNVPSTPLSTANPYLPDYAITYAPVLYLADGEEYWPSSWAYHLSFLTPWSDYTPMTNYPKPLTLANLNFTISTGLFLSQNNLTATPYPDWWHGYYGKPDSSGYSGGNVTIIAVNKTASVAPGVVDVFYFLFYSFNQGDNVGGETYGNHLSDIEHLMIRFYDGQPRYMFLSQHNDGAAYEFSAMQKEGQRPIVYVAKGGHANYPVAGVFNLVPNIIGLVYDTTTATTRWDAAKNYDGYWYSKTSGFVTAGGRNASTWSAGPPGVGYLQQVGKWGNKALLKSDPAQTFIFGQYKWSDGATGPGDPGKAIERTTLCITSNCIANSSLPTSSSLQVGQTAANNGGTSLQSPTSRTFCILTALALISLVYVH